MAATNWSGNYAYRASVVHRPGSLEELAGIVRAARSVQVVATRHTFTDIGDGDALVSLERLATGSAIAIDRQAMTVTVGPAVTYATLARELNRHELALANLASLPHISVTGAIATATHGSGDGQGNLATAVRRLQLMTGEGELITLAQGDPEFAGAVVSLGKLGVVTAVTLAVQPSYALGQNVYLDLEWDDLFADFDAVFGAGRSVSVFHDFGPRAREVWVKRPARTPAPPALAGARAATLPRHPVPGGDPATCTQQLGVPGPWSERLPHFRSEFTPSAGAEIQSELFVARGDAAAAIGAVRRLTPLIGPLLLTAELRTVAADTLWLSPQYGRDSVGLHFTWRREPERVAAVVAAVEDALAPLSARPHWGKVFAVTGAPLRAHYPRWSDFAALRRRLDPRGVFANPWLTARLG